MTRAEVISIGTELMLGEITDTNAAFIASQLPQYGIDLLYVSQVGDNPGRMRDVLGRAWKRSDVTFTTGGLGPTEDDLTREMIAAALGEEMQVDPDQERTLRAWMGARPPHAGAQHQAGDADPVGARDPERARHRPRLVGGARRHGDGGDARPASGDDRHVGAAGGAGAGAPSHRHPRPRTLKTTGLGESAVDEMLSPLLSGANPSIGIYAPARRGARAHRGEGRHPR